ncbi:MAG: ABC transporter permease [Chloroflexota bacterium]
MRFNRVWVLVKNELRSGSNFLFIFAGLMPIVISLVFSLAFGTLFSEKARLGVYDPGDSELVAALTARDFVTSRIYDSADALRDAVAEGAVDMGLVVPAGFDPATAEQQGLDLYIWGQSLASDRAIVTAAINSLLAERSAEQTPVSVNLVSLGEDNNIPIEDRLLPLLVLMTILIGGVFVPSGSLVEEKQKRTLTAITTTPVSIGEVFFAKGIVGAGLSFFVGVVILLMNRALGTEPALVLLVLAFSACAASAFGVMLGVFIKDLNGLFATIKALGLLLYAPGFVYLFPDLPEIIGQVFPTYYMIAPIVAITQEGASFTDVAGEIAVLAVLTALLVGAVGYVGGMARRRELLAV